MNSNLKFAFLLILILILIRVDGQQLNGTWRGNYSRTHLFTDPQSLIVELSVYNDSLISGTSHLIYKNGKYEHHKLSGIFHSKDSTILLKESLIEHNIVMADVYDVTYKMKLKDQGSSLRFEGKWKATKSLFGYLPYHKVWLTKLKDTVKKIDLDTNIFIIKEDSSLRTINRKIEIQKVIEILNNERDSIKVSIYDNGDIDQDSVSVEFNDSTIIKNKMLSDRAVIIYLSLDNKRQFHKLKMIAENLGFIPPNTALMVIETKKKRYEVRLYSDYEKSALVEFILIE